jgi:hypothetical protein
MAAGTDMTSPERIPKSMAEKFAGITALIDPFCARYLNEEYRQMIHRVVVRWPESAPRRYPPARKASGRPLPCMLSAVSIFSMTRHRRRTVRRK